MSDLIDMENQRLRDENTKLRRELERIKYSSIKLVELEHYLHVLSMKYYHTDPSERDEPVNKAIYKLVTELCRDLNAYRAKL